jgi:hypothetical protein
MAATKTLRVMVSGGSIWYLENHGKIYREDVRAFLTRAGDEDTSKTINGMLANPGKWFEISIPHISPIDGIIKNFKDPNDPRIDRWKGLQLHIKEGNTAWAIEKLKQNRGDDDYIDQCEIVLDEIVWQAEQRIG